MNIWQIYEWHKSQIPEDADYEAEIKKICEMLGI